MRFRPSLSNGTLKLMRSAVRKPGELQIGDDLSVVNRKQLVDGFDFDQNSAIDDQISSEAYFERYVAIDDRDRLLNFDNMSSLAQFVAKAPFIDRFEQARAELFVHTDR